MVSPAQVILVDRMVHWEKWSNLLLRCQVSLDHSQSLTYSLVTWTLAIHLLLAGKTIQNASFWTSQQCPFKKFSISWQSPPWLCFTSGPIFWHNCHGLSMMDYPKMVAELFTGKGCVVIDIPWQLCQTIGPLLSHRFPLASAKAQSRVGGFFLSSQMFVSLARRTRRARSTESFMDS